MSSPHVLTVTELLSQGRSEKGYLEKLFVVAGGRHDVLGTVLAEEIVERVHGECANVPGRWRGRARPEVAIL